jgi:hypothetical protein
MAADTPQDMSLEQQKLVRVKALNAIAERLRRVPLDDEQQACRELTKLSARPTSGTKQLNVHIDQRGD